jgi:hypothetical protein
MILDLRLQILAGFVKPQIVEKTDGAVRSVMKVNFDLNLKFAPPRFLNFKRKFINDYARISQFLGTIFEGRPYRE